MSERAAEAAKAQEGLASERIASERVDWVDAAKGICIILVVLMHTTLGVENAAGAEGWMHLFVAFASPFRMPDFFFLSGLFMARAISRDWRTFIDRRFVHFAYFYLLWLVISGGVKSVLGGSSLDETLNLLITGLYEPFSTLWFIYLLAIFSLALKLTRAVPIPIMLIGAAGLNLLHVETTSVLIDQFCHQFIFFYAGYAFAGWAFRLGALAGGSQLLSCAGLCLWALVNGALVAFGWHHWPPVGLVLGFAGAGAIIVTASLLSHTRVGHILRYIGAHSIVVYLSFFIPMAFFRILAIDFGLVDLDTGTLSLLILIAAVSVPLIGERVVRKTPLNFVFVRPAWATLKERPIKNNQRGDRQGLDVIP